jgi:hypothetical protein
MNSLLKNRKVIVSIGVLSTLFLLWLYGYERALNYTFRGVVTKVVYNEPKHYPVITIKNTEYNLLYNNWDNGVKGTIKKGDSVVKLSGSLTLEIIRQ